jgi:hypothetical protein
MADYNLILFGGPDENSVTGRIDRFLPIRACAQGVALGKTRIPGAGLAVKFVYPNPLSPEKLVVVNEATDREGLAILSFMRGTYAGAGLPDFVVFDSEVRRRAWGGITAAGFFDSMWQVDQHLLYYRGE